MLKDSGEDAGALQQPIGCRNLVFTAKRVHIDISFTTLTQKSSTVHLSVRMYHSASSMCPRLFYIIKVCSLIRHRKVGSLLLSIREDPCSMTSILNLAANVLLHVLSSSFLSISRRRIDVSQQWMKALGWGLEGRKGCVLPLQNTVAIHLERPGKFTKHNNPRQ